MNTKITFHEPGEPSNFLECIEYGRVVLMTTYDAANNRHASVQLDRRQMLDLAWFMVETLKGGG